MSETETQAAFARRLKKDPAQITRLKQAGRLVMRGRRVVIDESIARIQATESATPMHEANRQRLSEQRAAEGATEPKQAKAHDIGDDLEAIGLSMKRSQAQKIAAEAKIAQIELNRISGNLVDTDEVRAAINAMAAFVRSKIEGLPDRHAPELAASPAEDPSIAHALLTEACEAALSEISREAAAVASKLGQQ